MSLSDRHSGFEVLCSDRDSSARCCAEALLLGDRKAALFHAKNYKRLQNEIQWELAIWGARFDGTPQAP